MAQEKISFNNSLMSLPLATDKGLLWQCSCDGIAQSWDVDNRTLIRIPKGWQPGLFFLRKADADSAKFTVRVYEHRSGTLVATYPSVSLDAKVFRRPATVPNGQSWDTVAMPAGPNAAVSLNTGVYYLTVAGLTSEPFQVIDYEADQPPHGELLFALGNAYNLSEVPYKTGFRQRFGLPGVLCAGEPKDYTESEKSERNGERITYQRQYRVWTIDLPSIGQPLAGLLKSLEGHDTISISDRNRTLLIEAGRIAVTIKENDCCSLSATLSIDETISEWGTCKNEPELVEQTLVGAGPDYVDPADADAVADPYLPDLTSEPTYEAPNTSPVAGTVINEIIEIKECNEGWDKDGIRYRRRTTLVRADGSGGSYDEIIYSDVCDYNPLNLLLPRIISEQDTIIGRVGQPLNLPVIDPARFAPSAGQSTAPVITAKSLPPGLSYSNGRISGTPTIAGNSVALLAVTQPGGASILVEVPVSTAPASPSVLDVDLSIETSYDSEDKQLEIVVTAPFTPQVKLLTPNGAGQFATAVSTGTADTWKAVVPVTAEGKGKIAVRRAGSSGNGIIVPVQISTTSPGTSVGTPSWQKTLEINPEVTISPIAPYYQWSQELPAVSNADSLVRDYFHPVLKKWVLVKINLALLANQLIGLFDPLTLYNRIKDLIPAGTGGGFFGFTDADWEKIWLSTYQYIANREGWIWNGTIPDKPAYPTLTGGGGTLPPAVTATINANLSKYEADGPGLTVQGNCSNGDSFFGRSRPGAGNAVPDSSWHLLSRIDGNFANGTYAFAFATLPTGGILDPGDYFADIRIGVDNATIVSKPFTVVSTVPVPLNGVENFRIAGNTGPLEGVQGEVYALERRWSDNTWRPFSAPAGSVIYSPDAPANVAFTEFVEGGIRKGALSADPNAITQDTIITLIFFIGFNIAKQVTLKNQTSGAAVKKINFVLSSDVSGVGRVGTANVTVPVQSGRLFFIVQNGLDAYYGASEYKDAVLKAGNYDATGATVEVIWGQFPYTMAGTYKVVEVWRPTGVTQETSDPNSPDAYARNPPYTVVVGAQPPSGGGDQETTEWEFDTTPANTSQRIEYRFAKNGGVNGNLDKLEFRMADTYPDTPFYIDLQLSTGTYNFGRGFSRTSTIDPATGTPLRIALYDTGAYAGKNLKLGISLQTGSGATLLHNLSFTVPSATTAGYITLFGA